jgi:hypothetical protein
VDVFNLVLAGLKSARGESEIRDEDTRQVVDSGDCLVGINDAARGTDDRT